MLSVVLVNSFILSLYSNQTKFQEDLCNALFKRGKASRIQKKRPFSRLESRVSPESYKLSCKEEKQEVDGRKEHIQVHQGKRGTCQGCRYSGLTRQPKKGSILGEISQNMRHYSKTRESIYGCQACDVPLCKEGPCFDQYHQNL